MTHVPSNGSNLKAMGIPFAILIQPMADICDGEEEIPICTSDAEGPFRCKGCGTYINPGFFYENGAQTLVCNICGK